MAIRLEEKKARDEIERCVKEHCALVKEIDRRKKELSMAIREAHEAESRTIKARERLTMAIRETVGLEKY